MKDRIQSESELNFELKKAKQEQFELSEKNKALKADYEALDKDIKDKNKEKEELDKQKSEFEALQLKLVHENTNIEGMQKRKAE